MGGEEFCQKTDEARRQDFCPVVQPGTCFTFQPGHILYTFGPNLVFVSSRSRGVGMCESGFLDLHISIA
jgi:hypothetical protein